MESKIYLGSVEHRHVLLKANFNFLAQAGVDHVREDRCKLDVRFAFGLASEFLWQSFLNPSHGEFCSAVWNQVLESHHAGHWRERNDVSAVAFNHLRQKSLEHPKVSHKINFDRFSDFSFGVLEQFMRRHNSGIVNKNRHDSNFTQNFAAGFQNFLSVRDINAENEAWQLLITCNLITEQFYWSLYSAAETREFVMESCFQNV